MHLRGGLWEVLGIFGHLAGYRVQSRLDICDPIHEVTDVRQENTDTEWAPRSSKQVP